MWLYIKKIKKIKNKAWRTQSQRRDPSCPLLFQKWVSHTHTQPPGLLPFFFSPPVLHAAADPSLPLLSLSLAFCPERNPHPHDRCNSISVKKLRSSPGRASDKSMAVISRRQLQRICERKKKERAESVSRGKQTNKKKSEQTLVSYGHLKKETKKSICRLQTSWHHLTVLSPLLRAPC